MVWLGSYIDFISTCTSLGHFHQQYSYVQVSGSHTESKFLEGSDSDKYFV